MKRIASVTTLILAFCLALYGQTNEITCPQISLITPEKVMLPNSPALFAAEITENTEKRELQYEWSFSSGRILEGQGTSKVRFIVEGHENSYVHVRLKVVGLPEKCNSVFEDKVGVMPPIEGDPLDEFGKMSPNDKRARLDNFIISINVAPESTGLIQITFDEKDGQKYKAAQFKQMLKLFAFRKFDLNRIAIAYTTGDRENTLYWICPPGTALPKSVNSSYKIIQGNELRKEINRLSSSNKRL